MTSNLPREPIEKIEPYAKSRHEGRPSVILDTVSTSAVQPVLIPRGHDVLGAGCRPLC